HIWCVQPCVFHSMSQVPGRSILDSARNDISEKLAKAIPAQHSAAMHKPDDRAFFGHPRGLGYIAFTEAWERFSYYGMQSLLILYMVHQLLHPGHIEHIAGFAS